MKINLLAYAITFCGKSTGLSRRRVVKKIYKVKNSRAWSEYFWKEPVGDVFICIEWRESRLTFKFSDKGHIQHSHGCESRVILSSGYIDGKFIRWRTKGY